MIAAKTVEKVMFFGGLTFLKQTEPRKTTALSIITNSLLRKSEFAHFTKKKSALQVFE